MDLAAIPTAVASPDLSTRNTVDNITYVALMALAPDIGGSPPQITTGSLRSDSTIDVLQLAAQSTLPYTTVPAKLQSLGWQWLSYMQAVSSSNGIYREWLTNAYRFSSETAAASYAAAPFLLPATLAASAAMPETQLPGARARLWTAPDVIVPLFDPAKSMKGVRSALVWNRGTMVFEVVQSIGSSSPELNVLFQLSSRIDTGYLTRVGGGR